MAAKRQKELMAVIAHKENSEILCADEDYVDLCDLSVQKNDGNDESDTKIIMMIGYWRERGYC